MSGTLWFYWREFYIINRSTWPDMNRVRAAWGALVQARRVRAV